MHEGFPDTNDEQVDWDSARKSRRSIGDGECVEVAQGNRRIGFQDTVEEGMPDRSRLVFSVAKAALFFDDVKTGAYDTL